MQEVKTPARASPDQEGHAGSSAGPSIDSEITWLLHRAAQRMRHATGEQAEQHGLQLRDHIILSALSMSPSLTQGELARTLALDKTTLTSQLDRLERMGLVVRRSDPRDRRARIPEITPAGQATREKVAAACAHVEAAALSSFTQDQVQVLRHVLFGIIGDSEDQGSCL